jgi:hypothetical protein
MTSWPVRARLCVMTSYAITPTAQTSCAADAVTVDPERAASATSGGARAGEHRGRARAASRAAQTCNTTWAFTVQ